ncbi:MAG TPA: PPOX class F420-dependent oxidoreductase [Anaerolineae bacterium]|nr:PPOX class F420-dependent oxidoreductase [Anaerolineae bacterium]
MSTVLDLGNMQYIALETYRKSGEGVKTPVWVVADGERLLVMTLESSWKVKRIQNNAAVRIAKCDMQGNLEGEWVEGEAEVLTGESIEAKVKKLIVQKYGLFARFFLFMGWVRRERYVGVAITDR